LYLMTVAKSGERKSACDNLAQRGVAEREGELREAYDAERPAWGNRKEAWEKSRAEATGAKVKGMEAKRLALEELGPEPQPPLAPELTVDEPTLEGLFKLFQHGQPSAGLFAGEAATFLGGHGMAEDAKVRMAGALTHMWDGKPLSRTRAGERVTLPGRRLSAHLIAQPKVAALLTADPLIAGAGGQGLVNRFLIVAPETAAGTRFYCDPQPGTDEVIANFAQRACAALATPWPLAAGKANELTPRPLPLSPAAREKWIAFQHETERQIGPGGRLESIRGMGNRLPAHAARLAAVLTLFADLDAVEIDDLTMGCGIELARYYAGEALRLVDAEQVSPELRLAELARCWFESWPEELISLPDLYQRGPNAIRCQETARKVVALLEDHGFLVREPGSAVVAGHRRREVWRIVGKVGVRAQIG
jgi:hypothetical protein